MVAVARPFACTAPRADAPRAPARRLPAPAPAGRRAASSRCLAPPRSLLRDQEGGPTSGSESFDLLAKQVTGLLASELASNKSSAYEKLEAWLSSPEGGEEASDTRVVARVVHRLLNAYEKEAGEEFEGAGEHQWDRLYGIAKSVLGSSVSRRLLKRLVTSYLGQ